jgi:hypothetical protein
LYIDVDTTVSDVTYNSYLPRPEGKICNPPSKIWSKPMVSGQDFPWPRIDPLLLIAQRFAASRARGDIFVGLQGGVVTVTWQLGNGVAFSEASLP